MTWLRRVGSARLTAFTLVALLMGVATLDVAEARIGRSRGGGGFGSFGSRGSRSSDPGQGAARMQPLPSNQGRDPLAGGGSRPGQNSRVGQNGVPQRGSWLQRNPLLSGIMGAIAGTLIGAALINALGGIGNFGNIILMLLVAGVLFAIFRMIMARKQSAMAGNGLGTGGSAFPNQGRTTNFDAPRRDAPAAPIISPQSQSRQEYLDNGARNAPSSYNTGYDSDLVPTGNTQTRDQGLAAIALEDPTMTRERLTDALSSRFFEVQEAWTNGDRKTLENSVTGELYGEFSVELSQLEKRGERNIIKNIVIRRFEISEAWQEGDVEFATAHISARLIDYTMKGNQITAGDRDNPTDFAEFWTFVRMRGRGQWILSAINQEA
ncbi:MAG TPA: TIM44-like domain-containing protein [Abditibacterium sp.]